MRQEVEIVHHRRLAVADRAPGFGRLGLRRIFAETMAVNVASRATMASVGLRYVRTFHLDWDEPLPGAELGEVEYAITRSQWLAPDRGRAAPAITRRGAPGDTWSAG